jgi:hypothetical protein
MAWSATVRVLAPRMLLHRAPSALAALTLHVQLHGCIATVVVLAAAVLATAALTQKSAASAATHRPDG